MLLQGNVKAAGETQSSVQLELDSVFKEWVRAGSAALSVNGAETAAEEAAFLPASMLHHPFCLRTNCSGSWCVLR